MDAPLKRVEGLRSAPEGRMRAWLSGVVVLIGAGVAWAQSGPTVAPPNPQPDETALVSRLSLDRYKATIKGLTAFGDRRQGTERNRKAVDWIEAQLKSYGCPTERIKYTYTAPPPNPQAGRATQPPRDPNAVERTQGGARPRVTRARPVVNTDPIMQPDEKMSDLNSET